MNKQQIFYIHGGESYDDYADYIARLESKDIWDLPGQSSKRWTQTFADDLGDDFEVFTPRMPNPNNAKYREWQIWFERHFAYLHDSVVLIGCSLGAMFLTKYISENTCPFQVKQLILMACPVHMEGFEDRDSGSFRFTDETVTKLAGKAEKITILHSKDDFVVPYEHALKYQQLLPEADLITFTDKNHFLVAELPELVTLIKNSG